MKGSSTVLCRLMASSTTSGLSPCLLDGICSSCCSCLCQDNLVPGIDLELQPYQRAHLSGGGDTKGSSTVLCRLMTSSTTSGLSPCLLDGICSSCCSCLCQDNLVPGIDLELQPYQRAHLSGGGDTKGSSTVLCRLRASSTTSGLSLPA